MIADKRADVCVIGCGPAGAIVASELARAGRSVLVLEQGPAYSSEDQIRVAQSDGRRSINDDVDRRLLLDCTSPDGPDGRPGYQYGRAIGVGGSTLRWAGHAPRPIVDDLRVRTRFGYGRDWPIPYGELEPWLAAAEREIGVAGAEDNPYASPRSCGFPMPPHAPSWFDRTIFAPACARLGMATHSRPVAIASRPTASRPRCRACRACESCPSGARYSADRVHVPRLEATGRGELFVGHRVRRLEERRGRIDAAHAVRVADGEPLVVRAKTFVCALGGVETPRLLLLSGLGRKNGQLGRGFSDHRVNPFTMRLDRATGSRLGFATMACDHHRANVDREKHNTFGWWIWPAWPDVERLVELSVDDRTARLDELRDALGSTAGGYATLEIEGEGMVTLDASTDAFGDPLARVELTETARDRATDLACRAALRQVGEAMGAREIACDYLAWGSHPSGACAMASGPDHGVCDPSLRVFGADNLYVVGSAVFPHQGAANPTLTLAALSLRLAAHLAGGGGT